MIKKIIYNILLWFIIKRGYLPYVAHDVLSNLKKDLHYRKTVGLFTILKGYSNGFTGMFYYKLRTAGIPIETCLPDLVYMKMHPINGQFSHWIDDKLTLKYLLSKYDTYLPAYYGYIQKGRFFSVMDYPVGLSEDFSGLLALLQEKGALALKKNAGALSVGFYKVEFLEGSYVVNGQPSGKDDFIEFLKSLDDYIVTEYIVAHSFLQEINRYAPNIIRLIVINADGKSPKLISSYLRIGQRSTGYTELTPSGGIFCGIGLEDGGLFDAKLFDGPIVSSVSKHPDTDRAIEGHLPHWKETIESIYELCKYVPNLSYLGFDLIITEDSFKIIEINSLSGISYIQLFHPFLKSAEGKSFFQGVCI